MEDDKSQSTEVISKRALELKKPTALYYLDTLVEIFTNLPKELSNFGSIPCAQRSLYTGILSGGIVSAIFLVTTGRLRSFKYGFFSYLGMSIASWEYCNHKYKDQLAIYRNNHTTVIDTDKLERTTPNISSHPQNANSKEANISRSPSSEIENNYTKDSPVDSNGLIKFG